ncbi:MAG TPA: FixH family protein, partial [Gammaproteobacteria bacterium]|nr:FixH family protein [Gammaproteobacteria bacterium]
MSSKPRDGDAGRARIVVVLALAMAQWPALAADDAYCTSASGRYRVSYTSELEPLAINRIHSWVLHVESVDGDPVTGAAIEIGGGMPEHDHGLATSPRATEELGGGDYLIEGLRFHMPGRWEIVVDLRVGANRD